MKLKRTLDSGTSIPRADRLDKPMEIMYRSLYCVLFGISQLLFLEIYLFLFLDLTDHEYVKQLSQQEVTYYAHPFYINYCLISISVEGLKLIEIERCKKDISDIKNQLHESQKRLGDFNRLR